MYTTARLCSFAPVAAAALTAMLGSLGAHAQSVSFNSLVATGVYSMNGASAVNVAPWLNTATAVDVLEFTGAGVSSVGLHSYGSTSGDFGSRSSGEGIYDVTGSFTISLTLTNTTSSAAQASFDFYITPGMLALYGLPTYTSGQFVEAGVGFNILASNGASFASGAVLRQDASGTSFTETGVDLYAGFGTSYTVVGGNYALDLGVLNAGESVSLTYTLDSYAKGNAVAGSTTTIPEQQITVPEHWVEYLDCGYGYGDYGGEVNFLAAVTDGPITDSGCELVRELVPESVITIPETVVAEGARGGSQGSSGDPFSFNVSPVGTLSLPAGQNAPVGLRLTPTSVPEPAGIALALAALGAAGAATRRRRR